MRRHFFAAAFMAVGLSTSAFAQGLSGVLILENNDPAKSHNIIRLNLETGRHALELDGYDASHSGGYLAFVHRCGSTGSQLAIADPDGFTNDVSPCDSDGFSPNLGYAALSRDGSKAAVYDDEVKEDIFKPAKKGVHVYQSGGEFLGFINGFTYPAWEPNGRLLLSGMNRKDGPEFGIFRAADDFSTAKRIDDGRMNNRILHLSVSPDGDRVAFVYNDQLWEMSLATGKPRRLLAFDMPVRHPTYSPDGTKIAFIVDDPLHERITRGGSYMVHFFDGANVTDITIPFLPGGPMTWVEK